MDMIISMIEQDFLRASVGSPGALASLVQKRLRDP